MVAYALEYTDEALSAYITAEQISSNYVLRDELPQPLSHIVITSSFGGADTSTFDLSHGIGGDNSVTVYKAEAIDAKFAPIDGATLTNVSSITGENAEIAVSKVIATDIEIVNEV